MLFQNIKELNQKFDVNSTMVNVKECLMEAKLTFSEMILLKMRKEINQS